MFDLAADGVSEHMLKICKALLLGRLPKFTFVSNHVVYSWFQLPIAVIHGLHTFTICVDVTSVYALLQGPSSPIAVMSRAPYILP